MENKPKPKEKRDPISYRERYAAQDKILTLLEEKFTDASSSRAEAFELARIRKLFNS